MNHKPKVAVKALIIQEGKLLTIAKRDTIGFGYTFPGGGQEHGETLIEAIRRECREEIGCEVVVGGIVYVREYIGAHHQDAQSEGHVHLVEIIFRCDLPPDTVVKSGIQPDDDQVGIEWLPVAELVNYPFYPLDLRAVLAAASHKQIYVGDIY